MARKTGSNSFEKGMNKDLNEQFLKQGMYRDARNVVLNSVEGNLYSVTNERGVEKKLNLPQGFKVIGHEVLNNEVVLLLADGSDSIIGTFNFDTEVFTNIFQDPVLNFDLNHQIDVTARVDFQGHRIVYFTDDFNPPRAIDLDEPPTPPGLDSKLNLFLTFLPPLAEPTRVFEFGNLEVGVYQFVARYRTSDNEVTNFGPVSNPVPLVDENQADGRENYDGAPPENLAGKSIEVTISHLDPTYEAVDLAVISYEGLASTPLVNLIATLRNNPGGTVTFTYSSPEQQIEPLTFNQVAVGTVFYNKAKCIEQKDNILFLSNLKSTEEELNFQQIANNIQVDYFVEGFAYEENFSFPIGSVVTNNGVGVFGSPEGKIEGETTEPFDDYKNPLVAARDRGFRRDEVYAFAFVPIFKDGSEGFAYHIPYHPSSNLEPWVNNNETYPTNVGYPSGPVTHHKFPSAEVQQIFEESFTSNLLTTDINPPNDIENVHQLAGIIRILKIKVKFHQTFNDAQKQVLSGFKIVRGQRDNPVDRRVITSGIANPFIRQHNDEQYVPVGFNGKIAYGDMFSDRSNPNGERWPGGWAASPAVLDERMFDIAGPEDPENGGEGIIPKELHAFWSPEILHGLVDFQNLTTHIELSRVFQAWPLFAPTSSGSDSRSEEVINVLGSVPGTETKAWETPALRYSDFFNKADQYVGPALPFTITKDIDFLIDGVFVLRGNVRPILITTEVLPVGSVGDFRGQKKIRVDSLQSNDLSPGFINVSSFGGKDIVKGNNTPFLSLRTEDSVKLGRFYGIDWGVSADRGSKANLRSAGEGLISTYLRIGAFRDASAQNNFIDQEGVHGNFTYEVYNLVNEDLDKYSPISNIRYLDSIIEFLDGDFSQIDSGTFIGKGTGDTFIFKYALENNVTFPLKKRGALGKGSGNPAFYQAHIVYMFYESEHNLNYRHSVEPEGSIDNNTLEPGTKPYFPKYRTVIGNANPIGFYNMDPILGYATPYNRQYSFDNNVRPSFERPLFFTEVNDFPNLTVYSKQAVVTEQADSYRVFFANNQYNLPKDKGKIVDTFVMNNTLFLHTEQSLWKTYVNQLNQQASSEGQVFLGTGGLFKIPATEVNSIDGGYAGTLSQWAGVNTPYGRFFADALQRKVFLFNGQQLKDISASGMDTFFREFFKKDLTVENDNPANGFGLLAGYDYDLDRLFLVQRGGPEFTLSYMPQQSVWVSFHDFLPDTFFNYGDRLFTTSDDALYEHNVGEIAKYYNEESFNSTIDFVVNAEPFINKAFDNMFFEVRFFDSGNSWDKDAFFSAMQFENDYQVSFKDTLTTNAFNPIDLSANPAFRPVLVRLKNDQYQLAVPREQTGPGRMKSKWLLVRLIDEPSDPRQRFVLNSVHTIFRPVAR